MTIRHPDGCAEYIMQIAAPAGCRFCRASRARRRSASRADCLDHDDLVEAKRQARLREQLFPPGANGVITDEARAARWTQTISSSSAQCPSSRRRPSLRMPDITPARRRMGSCRSGIVLTLALRMGKPIVSSPAAYRDPVTNLAPRAHIIHRQGLELAPCI